MRSLERISVRIFSRPSRRIRARQRSGQEGYTLLFAVFLVAVMLISLTTAALKIETQGQREREEEMVWRGHQYERGIRRYVAKFGRYPTKIDDLVKATSGVRYMREAYKDPMNKDDGTWRFIYVTPAGALIGSVRYTSLIQMALMDKMAQFGGAGTPGMAGMPASPVGSSPFGNSTAFGGSSAFGNQGSSAFGNQGSSTFGQQGTQPGSNPGATQQNPNQSGDQGATGNNSPRQSAHRPESSGRRQFVGFWHRRPAVAKRQRLRFLLGPRRQLSFGPNGSDRRKHHRRRKQSREGVAEGLQRRKEVQRVGIHLQPDRAASPSRRRHGRGPGRWHAHRPAGNRLIVRQSRQRHGLQPILPTTGSPRAPPK